MMKQNLMKTFSNLKDQKIVPFAAMIILILGIPFFWENGVSIWQNGYFTGSDFATFYGASVQVFNNDQSSYGTTPSPELEKQIGRKVWPFLYPPTSLLILAPLSVFEDISAAGKLMLVLNLFLMLVGVFLTYKALSIPENIKGGLILVLITYSFNFYAFKSTIGHGQVNFIILLCIVLFWIALKRKLPGSIIAFPLALAVLLKVYPLLLAFVLLWRKDWRTLSALGTYIIIGVVLSLIFLPVVLWIDWISIAAGSGAYSGSVYGLSNILDVSNLSLRGFYNRLFDGIEPFAPIFELKWLVVPLSYISAIITIIISNISSYKNFNNKSLNEKLDIEMSVYLFAIFLIAPISWEHHLVMVFPAIIVAMVNLFASFRINSIGSLVTMVTIVILAWCFPGNGVINFGPNYAISMFEAKVASIILLFVYLNISIATKSTQ